MTSAGLTPGGVTARHHRPVPTPTVRSVRQRLTPRGRGMLLVGIACVTAGVVAGSDDLLRAGAFLVLVPLVAAVVVPRARPRLLVDRVVEPGRTTVGRPAQMTLTVRASRRTLPAPCTDALPPALGPSPRFVLAPMGAGQAREVRYTLTPRQRGLHRLSELTVLVKDPFGLAQAALAVPAPGSVLVLPAALPLTGTPAGGHGQGEADGRRRAWSAGGEDDAATRAYRPGDDVRRVHWRATARTGELVVRQEENPPTRQAIVCLDTRTAVHPTAASLEWAVTVAASVAVHLAGAEWEVRLVGGDGTVLSDVLAGTGGVARAEVLREALAFVAPRTGRITGLLDLVAGTDPTTVLVMVTGVADAATLDDLERVRPGRDGAASPSVLLGLTSPRAPQTTGPGWRAGLATVDDAPDVAWRRALTGSTTAGSLVPA